MKWVWFVWNNTGLTIEINESLTIQFIVYIKEKYNVDVNSINSCNLIIYDSNKENNNIIK